MKRRIQALLARLFPRWFSPPLTDSQIAEIWKQARKKQLIRTYEIITTFGQPQERKP